ncbi:MAG: hypothetical protein H6912_00880 [Kordiimonadaceae bacterium]|nr:hypothetical protein [Kordiimonadaceae bacterium]
MSRKITNNKIAMKPAFQRLFLGVCSAALFSAQIATAAETDATFGLSAEGSYDDNRYLSNTNKQSVYILNIRPTVGLTIENEGSQTTFTAYGAYALSSDQAVQKDRFNFGAGVSGVYEYEYSTLTLGGGFDRQSVFETEFLDTGIYAGNNGWRDRGNASFGLKTSLNETWSLRLSDSFQILDYSTINYNNYWSNVVGLGVDVALNERTSLVQNFSYLRYEPDNIFMTSLNSYSYLAGLSYELDENTLVTVTGGATYLSGDYRWSAIFELSHQLENNLFSVRGARELLPSGLGGVRQSDSVEFDSTYNYSESVNMGISASWRRSKELNNITQLDNEFFGISPWVSFEVMRDLNIRLRYQLRRQKIGLSNDWGISNVFSISIAY